MEQVVIDTNVVVKLFANEPHSKEALQLKDAYLADRFEVAVPSLMKYELINVLKYKNFSAAEIKLALIAVDDYFFRVEELSKTVADLTADFAIRLNITSYDASYLAVAALLGATLYTADEKLERKARELGFVRHIKDFN